MVAVLKPSIYKPYYKWIYIFIVLCYKLIDQVSLCQVDLLWDRKFILDDSSAATEDFK